VADVYGKQHERVLDKIKNLDYSPEFAKHNIVLSSYVDSSGKSNFCIATLSRLKHTEVNVETVTLNLPYPPGLMRLVKFFKKCYFPSIFFNLLAEFRVHSHFNFQRGLAK